MSKNVQSEPAGAPPRSSQARPKDKRSPLLGLFAGLALLVAVAALAASAYVGYRTRPLFEINKSVASLQQTTRKQQQSIGHLRTTLANVTSRLAAAHKHNADAATARRKNRQNLANLDARITALAARTSQSIAKLHQKVGEPRAGAHFADAAYLLRVARHQARIRRDPAAMKAALVGAREAIEKLDRPAAKAVGSRIGDALSALRALPQKQATATARQLAALAARVPSLPIAAPGGATSTKPSEPRPQPAHWWQRIGPGLAHAFSTLVTIRHPDHDIRPLLAPDQRWFLYRNLTLELDAARIAALEHNAAGFRAAIQRARQWLGRYFDNHDKAVAEARAELAHLANRPLHPALPKLDGVFKALKRLRHQASQERHETRDHFDHRPGARHARRRRAQRRQRLRAVSLRRYQYRDVAGDSHRVRRCRLRSSLRACSNGLSACAAAPRPKSKTPFALNRSGRTSRVSCTRAPEPGATSSLHRGSPPATAPRYTAEPESALKAGL